MYHIPCQPFRRPDARITVLTGAGVSAASGVPTFRGADGLWKNFRPEALATAIRRLAEDQSLAQRIGAAGRATFEQQASESVLGGRWLGLLETLVRGA